jgi:hypothetical protein
MPTLPRLLLVLRIKQKSLESVSHLWSFIISFFKLKKALGNKTKCKEFGYKYENKLSYENKQDQTKWN